MNKYRILLIVMLLAFWKPEVISQCGLVSEVVNNYQRQVHILALDQMLRSGTSDTNSIRIPDEYTTPVFESLSAIYSSIFIEEADSVFNIYCINNSTADEPGGYTADKIYVKLDTSIDWTNAWLQEIPLSGNSYIDSLLEGLEYEVELYIPSLLDGVVKITFDEIINLPTLVRLLETENGVLYAERVPYYGGGNHVTYEIDNDNQYIDFILGWDDCQSGCISNRIWKFLVNRHDCSVDYLGAFGRPVTFWYNGPPYPVNCDISSAVQNLSNDNILLFPNPVDEILNIELEHVPRSLVIYDILGRTVFFESPMDRASQIEIHYLLPGFYFVVIDDQLAKQFIKK